MRILIVDDEPPARQRLADLVADIGPFEVVGEAANGRQAIEAIEASSPDLLLLDIRMPGMDGLEVARHLSALDNPPAVVFTTAYDDHALAAFEANAIDYLLKPIRRERLAAALARATNLTRAQLSGLRESSSVGARVRSHLSATMFGRLELLPVERIRYFKAEHKYVTAGHPDGALLVEDTLSALEKEFGERFLRVHRNALVAREHVRALDRDSAGRLVVRLDRVDERLEVSRRLAVNVRKVLQGG